MTQVTVCVSLILNHLSEAKTVGEYWTLISQTSPEYPFVFSFGAPFWAFFIIAALTLAHPDPTIHCAEVAHILISVRISPFAFLYVLLLAIAISYV